MNPDERPIGLVWGVTQACEHCRAEANPGGRPEALTTAAGKSLLVGAREFGDGQLVGLSGGDPLESDPLCPYVPEGYDGQIEAET